MKIGIISDTHGRIKRLSRAIELLKTRGAAMLVHCGDIGSPECISILGSSDLPAYAVAGNMDRNADELRQAAESCGVNFEANLLVITLPNGKKLGLTHGDDQAIMYQLTTDGKVTYICHGHTHQTRDEVKSGIRLINPGAIYNPRSPSHPTAALLDEQAETVEFVKID